MTYKTMNIKETYPKVTKSLRAASIKRNAKTALFLGVASSGAIVSAPALAVTAVGSFAALYLWGIANRNSNVNNTN